MPERKKRKRFFDSWFFGDTFVEDFAWDSIAGGYSISVTQVGDKTIVRAKAGEGTDIASLRRDLERQYPRAEIYIEGEKPPIMEIDEEEVQEKPRYPHSASPEEASKPAIKELSGEDEEA